LARQLAELVHEGELPKSLNVLGSGNRHVYQREKQKWEGIFQVYLLKQRVPRRLAYVEAQGVLTVPDKRRRDSGNFRFFIEKALGDTLQKGGWLEDDDHTRYRFGDVTIKYEKGVRATAVALWYQTL
jgi:hypothetical protein